MACILDELRRREERCSRPFWKDARQNLLFTYRNGGPITDSYLAQTRKTVEAITGIRDFSALSLRYFAANAALKAGASEKTIQDLLGFTTLRYVFRMKDKFIEGFVAFLIRSIRNYIKAVLRRYQEKDRKRLEEKNEKTNSNNKTIKESEEVKLLKHYDFFLLENDDRINHSNYVVFRRRFATYYSTDQLEKKFMALDSRFPMIKELKEEYIEFNSTYFGKEPEQVRTRLDELIEKYKNSGIYIFIDFAEHLEKFQEQIIASFKDYDVPVRSKEREDLHRRLSNGPMEGFNRKPKDLKRTSRGFDNFEYTKNRILWSERKNAHILAVPKKLEEVQTKTGKKRGPYNKE